MQDFKDIAFGYSSAESERTHDPALLIEGHIDFKASTHEALYGSKYLFLGYKGAGKSTIGEHIQLTLSDTHDHFIRLVALSDFPFTPFSKIIRGDAEPETKYPTAWSWILLIYLLESFARDSGVSHFDYAEYQDAISAFRQMGLSPAASPATIVRTSVKNSFKLSLPGKLAEYQWSGSETRPASEIPDFVESLKQLVDGVRSGSRHYIIIDGLDDILTSREVQFKSLSALIFEVSRLNARLSSNNVPAKIIVLCRTDMFERIPGANKNKIRQDQSVELDWYHDPREPDRSLLVQLAQLRTKRSIGPRVDLFEQFFPPELNGAEIRRYLLDMTRHTPRDFLQLLTHIQTFSTPGMLGEGEIKSGIREYSIKYFLPEIKDELSGYASPDEITQIIRALGKVRKRDFKLQEMFAATSSLSKPLKEDRVFELLEYLFECSALGNIQNRPGGTTFYTFKYRNRHSSFNEDENIMLHRGLWKALNIT